MKKLIFALALVALWQYWSPLSQWLQAKPANPLGSNHSVVLYATSWCGYCAKTRAFLNDHQVAFTEYDIEKSSEAYASYRALGGNGVPVVVIGDQVIHGFSPDEMAAAL